MEPTTAMPRGRRRRDLGETAKGERRYTCQHEDCGRSFTRAEHLQRHLLNHTSGAYTCERCRAHFKRKDLLDRHMARHRQKDEEVGVEGCGILNTRKRMWKDADGNIVTKKPTLSKESPPRRTSSLDSGCAVGNTGGQPDQPGQIPISPPLSHDPSLGQSIVDDHDSGIGLSYNPLQTANESLLSSADHLTPINHTFWASGIPQHEPAPDALFNSTLDDAPFDDIFNPDTASSFNNPFTTMSNYNWLFDLDLNARQAPVNNMHLMPDPLSNFACQPQHLPETNQIFEIQLEHMQCDKASSTYGQQGSYSSNRTDSPQQLTPDAPLITPPLGDEDARTVRNGQPQAAPLPPPTVDYVATQKLKNSVQQLNDLEQPLSMLCPSRCLPIIDDLARQQLLDLIDIIQPVAPDGSVVMRSHPLLSLSNLQTYCDLFFTRFNCTYPLIHMATFDPSHVDTLLLAAVLLLGATYGEKDAHQLAVCIHDVLRPQIFANAGFSATPSLWILQTLLLVECFGKSRAGQKQHDMSHLFHGLLINLIRRSDCQHIRPPTIEEATDDLEDDWRTWVEAEQKKRLAFLCFMWDTQHAVLFCQSLCMSAFELRSTLPCDQSLWEADSAESWHRLRQKAPTSPLFLSCLKMYLHPTAAQVPKNLNAMSRSLLLHGLMSIAWDMQRRDQTSLGVLDGHSPIGDWKVRLAASYNAWHRDFETWCAAYRAQLTSVPNHSHAQIAASSALGKEFEAFRTAALALYHSAHILLYTPFLDLQIYAGARHILGRPVARADYVRSQRVVKKWVSTSLKEANNAVWHAAALVRQGMEVLEGDVFEGEPGSASPSGNTTADVSGAGGRLWHLPWAVYLGTLVIWGVWYAKPVQRPAAGGGAERTDGADDEDEIIWDPRAEMRGLLEAILNTYGKGSLAVDGEGGGVGIAGVLGKRGVNGLAAAVSKALGKVRWAVVHDAMMVLRGLVCWRLVGGGGM